MIRPPRFVRQVLAWYYVAAFARDTRNTDALWKFEEMSTSLLTAKQRAKIAEALLQNPVLFELYHRSERDADVPLSLAELSQLPENTLGYHVAQEMRRIGTEPFSSYGTPIRDALDYAKAHARKYHDVQHVVSGWPATDESYELGLFTMLLAQAPSNILARLVFLVGAYRVFGMRRGSTVRRAMHYIVQGYQAGLDAENLLFQDWQALLPLDLEEVRRRLHVRPFVEPDFVLDEIEKYGAPLPTLPALIGR